MYGMVNEAIRSLITEEFGEQTWEAVRTKAESPSTFAPFQIYDDSVTYSLVGACVDVLELPADAVLRTFGHYWVEKIATKHYADLMDRTGTDFVTFVKNLDHMHARIQTTFRNYEPPSFRILELEIGRFQVDYYSRREGLLPFVEGLFEGLSKYFEVQMSMEHVPDDSHPMPCKRMIIHFESLRE